MGSAWAGSTLWFIFYF